MHTCSHINCILSEFRLKKCVFFLFCCDRTKIQNEKNRVSRWNFTDIHGFKSNWRNCPGSLIGFYFNSLAASWDSHVQPCILLLAACSLIHSLIRAIARFMWFNSTTRSSLFSPGAIFLCHRACGYVTKWRRLHTGESNIGVFDCLMARHGIKFSRMLLF